MKKFLSVMLAMVMVLSSVAFALPSAVTVFDAAEVAEVVDDEANLAGDAVKVKRGINMLTGTKQPLTGEMGAGYTSVLTPACNTTLGVGADPLGKHGQSVLWTIVPGADRDYTGNYTNLQMDFDSLLTQIGHPYVYVYYDVLKYVPEKNGYNAVDAHWIMNSTGDSNDVAYQYSTSELNPDLGWVTFNKVMNLTYYNQQSNKPTKTTDPTRLLLLQSEVKAANTVPVYYYLDNIIVAPAYKVTYYNKAGTIVVKEDYICDDGNGNLLTSFAPQGFLEGAVTYGGWATSVGGTAVDSIALDESNNADIKLYATVEQNAFDGAYITTSDKLTKLRQKVTATAVLNGNPEIIADYVTWTSSNPSVISAEKNKDGSATLTSFGAGTATITYTYKYGSVTNTIKKDVIVATAPIVDDSLSGTNLGIDTDMFEYITVNVTNTSSTEQVVSVRYNTDSATGNTFTIPVPANVTNYDVYADMSQVPGWTGTLKSIRFTVTKASGVTINNKKLWAKLSTELRLLFSTDATFIGRPGDALNIAAIVDCDLEGIYDKSYTWTYDVTNNCATVVKEQDGSLTITAGENKEGYVTITATSNEDAQYSVSKTIYVKTGAADSGDQKLIAYKWDFENASNTGWDIGTGHHKMSTANNDGTITLIKTDAVLYGTSSAVAVETTKSSSGYTLKQNGSGSIAEYGKNSTKFSMSDYPYFCIVAKSEVPGNYNLKGYFRTTNLQHAEGRTVTETYNLTTEFKTYVMDVSAIAAQDPGANYAGIMFVTNTTSTIDASTINSSNVASSPLKYTNYRPVIIEEMYFANYDPSKEEELPMLIGIKLETSSETINGENTVTLTPNVYANQTLSNKGIKYTTDNNIVNIFQNEDGTATVTPTKNGTVTIRATSVVDETAYDEVTITITNVREKLVAYDFNIMSMGNSYLSHNPHPHYTVWLPMDEPARGMAASAPDKDYYSQIEIQLLQKFSGSSKKTKFAGNQLERSWMTGLKDESKTDDLTDFNTVKAKNAILSELKDELDYIKENNPNLITIQVYENARIPSVMIAELFYGTIFEQISEAISNETIVCVITPFNGGSVVNKQMELAREYGFVVANLTDIMSYGYRENPYLAFMQYPEYDAIKEEHPEYADFRSHPGDLGMYTIAERVVEQFAEQIPTKLRANYVYVPDSIEIVGGNVLNGETLKLSIKATPEENSTTAVHWSVDDENIATIDEDGLLTAVNNGTVTVTAVCAYNDAIKATLTVTVTGQHEVYTISYAAGTDDVVTGLPASDPYAAGTYTLSENAPDRNGYKFKGWAETENGTPVKTVEMTADKTVYATWEYADHWYFDTEGDFEGISFGGFHTYVRYEAGVGKVVGTAQSYNGGIPSVFDNTLLIDSEKYNKFVVTIQITALDVENPTMNLKLTTTDGVLNYSIPMTDTSMQTYTFDISDATGTITGFVVQPSCYEFTLYIDEAYFTYEEPKAGVKLELGEKQSEGNTRYAVFGGVQYELYGNVFELRGEENTLVKVVEMDEGSVVKVEYYYVDFENGNAKELTSLENHMTNGEQQSVRLPDEKTRNLPGLRFMASVTTLSKNEGTDFAIEEYGYIIALEKTLVANNEVLTFDSDSKFVTGVAYKKGSFDKVFDSSVDGTHVFTGVLYGIPETEYSTNLVARTYTKLSIGGEVYTIYGQPMTASFCDIALGLKNSEELSDEQQALVDAIIEKALGADIGTDWGEL